MSAERTVVRPAKVTHQQVEAFHRNMREEFRLKANVDYAIALKYGEAHLVCPAVFFPDLAGGGIEFATIHTY